MPLHGIGLQRCYPSVSATELFPPVEHSKGQAMQQFLRVLRDESATTAVEYSIMLGFIMLVLIGAVATFGVGQGGKWNGIWGQMTAHGM